MAEYISGPAVVGEFEKVSYPVFERELKKTFGIDIPWQTWVKISPAPDDPVDLGKYYEELALPARATHGSAGHDFRSPVAFELRGGETVTIPTGIRVKIRDGWFLMCTPKSGLGFKYRLQLDNTVGIIDSDYYYSDNEGHIMLRITNDNRGGKILRVERGQGFAQGIFLPYGVTVSDNAEAVRNGGFGSTGA